MTSKTAKSLEDLLGRKLYPQERGQILRDLRTAGRLVDVKRQTRGNKKVALTYSNGSGRVLSPKPTGGTVFREGKPVTASRAFTRPAATPEPVLAAPSATTLARPRERREHRASAPTRGDPDADTDPPPPCACGECGLPRRAHLKPPHRYYHSDECRKRHARARQRRKRNLDRENPDRVIEREGTIGELARGCKCRADGVYFDRQLGTMCVRCGRRQSSRVPAWVNGSADWRPDPQVVWALGEQKKLGSTQNASPREWKTRPTRQESELRRRKDRELGYRFDKPKRKADA